LGFAVSAWITLPFIPKLQYAESVEQFGLMIE